MIKICNTDVMGWGAAVRGMRNPMNSWDKSDSHYDSNGLYILCEADKKLMERLAKAGDDHGKFMRMINVSMDITAPLYWWKEFDTYKVGTVANSCSTMHKVMAKVFERSDFSFEKIEKNDSNDLIDDILELLNDIRDSYVNYDEYKAKGQLIDGVDRKDIWYSLIQLLPESYNQKRTIQLNYAVLKNMYHARKNHKLDEWLHFCEWIEKLPLSELIIE